MKHTFLVLMFAAVPLTAQGSEKARTELANAIAIEEQERDLAKAERAYRDALDDNKLSDAARRLAKQRLGALLQKLGRVEEAKQFLGADKGTIATLDDVTNGLQDSERTKALREKARELVQQKLGNPTGGSQPLEQLKWIGEPAIPEIAAAIATRKLTMHDAEWTAVSELAGLLWYFGGAVAESHLETLLRSGDVAARSAFVARASELREPRMERLAERWLRQESDEEIALRLLSSGSAVLMQRLDLDVVVEDVARRSPSAQSWVLGVLANVQRERVTPTALAKAHALVRAFLVGADPESGQAAQRFLGSGNSQASPEGVELLIEQIPRFLTGGVSLQLPDLPAVWVRSASDRRLRVEVATDLWPKLVDAARALPLRSPYRSWLLDRIGRCALVLDAAVASDLVELIGNGDEALVGSLRGKVTPSNAAAIVALLERIEKAQVRNLLIVLSEAELPPELFEPLRQRADARAATDPRDTPLFAMAIAKTGNAQAAAWLLDAWRASPQLSSPNAVDALVELGRRNRDETVRAAMRTVVGNTSNTTGQQSYVLLALLAMGDEPALRLVEPRQAAVVQPYAAKSKETTTPLRYLLLDHPDPPHGFSVEQRIAMLRAWDPPASVGDVNPWDARQVADDMVVGLAECVFGGIARDSQSRSWQGVALQRLRDRDDEAALRAWIDRALSARGSLAQGVLEALNDAEVGLFSSRIESMLTDEELGTQAANALLRAKRPLDVAAMLVPGHRLRYWAFDKIISGALPADDATLIPFLHDKLDQWRVLAATQLGERASVAAVPELILLLKDPDSGVRAAVMNALIKIRAHHEQQSYWDRIVKGLDASPASAAEKLLLQAKPGASKQQRLLAITSLGTLGAPEALPFLIEWTQDPDADVAKKANDAITQIHLNPRR